MPLSRRIIPVLDIAKGGVVKGVQLGEVEDSADPVMVARAYEAQGADELAFIDVSSQRGDMLDEVLRAISEQVFIPVTAGGGIHDAQEVKRMLTAGADRVMLNTAAVLKPELVTECVEKFGSEALIGAVDVRRTGNDDMPWEVVTHGGRKASGLDARAWVQQLADYGIGEILVTSLDQDGGREGFDQQLVETMAEIVSVPLVVAGGAGRPEDVEAVLEAGLADGVMIASIFHSGEYNIGNVKDFLAARGVPVRRRAD